MQSAVSGVASVTDAYIALLRTRGGETGALIAGRDWTGTSIGPIETWPQSLRTALSLLLMSPLPIAMLWNEDGVMLYNDAYSVIAGGRHPHLLGSKVREGWPEVADFNDNVMKVGLSGGTLQYKDQELTLYRSGVPEKVWMNLDYSPVFAEDGRPAGVIAMVVETSERVRAERRTAEERGRLERMLQQMPGFAGIVNGPDHVYTYVNDAYRELSGGRDFIGRTVRQVFPEIENQGYFERLDSVFATGQSYVARAMPVQLVNGDRFVDLLFEPIRDTDGSVTGIFIGGYDVTEAQRASERIALALDSGTIVGTWVWDITDDLFTADERFARTFQLDAGSLRKGMPIAEVKQAIHPDDVPKVDLRISEAMTRGGHYVAQYRVGRGDEWVWIEANGRVEMNDQGVPVRFPGVLIDINERKTTEVLLENAREQLELAQIAGGIGVFAIATGSDVLVASPEFCKIFGHEVRATISTNELEAQVFAEERSVHSNVDTRIDGTAPLDVTYRIRRKGDGALRWIGRRAQFVRDADGHVTQMIGIVQDITDRRRAEIDLMESQAHLALMVESAQEYAIISISPDGVITSWNSGAERVFGGTAAEMTDQPFAILFTPEDRADGTPERELKAARTTGRSIDQRWHVRRDSDRFYANGITSAMFDHDGRLTGFTKIARDMTAERLAHDNLVAARDAAEVANIAKSEFLANMSHEIRTPMNAIIGLSNLLAMSQPLTPKQRQFVSTLQSSADSMLDLVNDLLDISKIEARSVELEAIPFSLTGLVQEVVSMMAVRVREKGLQFTGNGECVENRAFIGDPTRIRQIIVNLCSNAVKFTDKGGVHVAITCTATDDPQVETVCIQVKDTGIGIPADKLDSIFHKFTQADSSVTRRFGGTGLGLAITRTLTEIMGGTITVESVEHRGSVFTVCLPLRLAEDVESEEAPRRPLSVADRPESVPALRVLLVEDYEPNVLVAQTFLEQLGYGVDVAATGLEAVTYARQGGYAAIVMDVQMPGMNGFEATRLIRAFEAETKTPRVPVIGMTAHALAGDRERCLAAGMDDYIAKPFNPTQLEEVVRAATRERL